MSCSWDKIALRGFWVVGIASESGSGSAVVCFRGRSRQTSASQLLLVVTHRTKPPSGVPLSVPTSAYASICKIYLARCRLGGKNKQDAQGSRWE